MKRTPMPARTKPIPRSGASLVSTARLDRRTRIKPRSDKTARIYVTRRALVADLLAERPWCEIRWDADCWQRSTEVHEPGMRSRLADICDPAQCTATCHYCHSAVHANPAEATERGWLIPSWQGGEAA
jgi:hypothetical protein